MTDTQPDTKISAYHLGPEEGETIWFGEAVYTVKASAASTGGALTFADATIPPGNGPPPHIHQVADESYHILHGEVEFLSGDDTIRAGAGDFLFIPHGTLHAFRNVGLHPARLAFFFTPGGMDEYFTSIGIPAKAGEIAPGLTPEQIEQVTAIAPYHCLEIPPPR